MNRGAVDHRAELAALAEHMRPSVRKPEPPESVAEGEPPEATSVRQELHDAMDLLRTLAADAAASVDDAVEDHPRAAVAAAFLLGLCLGRLTARG